MISDELWEKAANVVDEMLANTDERIRALDFTTDSGVRVMIIRSKKERKEQ